jgi:hypothetical protein
MEPHPFGHDLHVVTKKILEDIDQPLLLVVGADDICIPCTKLNADSICVDVLPQCDDKPSKQKYNDSLDQKVLDYLNLEEGAQLSVREYLNRVNAKLDGIEKVCTHPKEDENYRIKGITMGLKKLGIA